MINFWGIQRSFLIIRSVSSAWKYNFSGRRGAVNGQQLVVMDAVRQSTGIPVTQAWLSLCGTWAVLGNDELQPSLVSLSAWMSRCTHVPRLQEVIGEITWLNPSHLWWYLSFTGSSGSVRKFQFLLRQCVVCVNPCAGAVRGERRIHQHLNWQTHVPVLFMKSYKLKSICRSGVFWVPKENPLTVVSASSQQDGFSLN